MNDLERSVLTEGEAAFEHALFQNTVATARRTRRARHVVRCASALALIFGAIFLWFPKSTNLTLASRAPAIHLLPQTPPAPIVVTVRTKQFPSVLHTKPLRSEQLVTSFSREITVLRTSDSHPEILRINDEQLFSMLEGQPVALIGRGPNAMLIFPGLPEVEETQ